MAGVLFRQQGTVTLTLLADTQTILIPCEMTLVDGSGITLGGRSRIYVMLTATVQAAQLQVAYSRDAGVTFEDRGTIDILSVGIPRVFNLLALGNLTRLLVTPLVAGAVVAFHVGLR